MIYWYVTQILQYVEGVNKVWGMGVEIATILATYGTIFGGNIVSLNPSVSMVRPYSFNDFQYLCLLSGKQLLKTSTGWYIKFRQSIRSAQ